MVRQTYVVGATFLVGTVMGLLVSYFSLSSTNFMPYPTARAHQQPLYTPPTFRSPMSHKEVDSVPVPDEIHEFTDELHHTDNTETADELSKKVRVLCWVMTQPGNLESRAKHVKATWGKRCTKLLFVSDKPDKKFPDVIDITVEKGRDHLTAKTMAAFDYIYKNHYADADWFMKADDDTYVIVENLRYMLSAYNSSQPVFFGHNFKVIVNQGYTSGGAGYVVSKEGLRRFGERKKGFCAKDLGAEDVEWGRCMEKLNVTLGDSRDKLGRTRFHCFDPATFIHGGFPDWFREYDGNGAQKNQISDYAISFHYITVEQMYNLEFFVYHLHPYGIITGLQDLNRPQKTKTKSTKAPPTTTPHR